MVGRLGGVRLSGAPARRRSPTLQTAVTSTRKPKSEGRQESQGGSLLGRGRRGSVRLCSPSWKPAASHRPPRGHHGSRWETPKSAALLKRAHGPTGSGARQPRRLAGRGRRGRRRPPCANAQLDLWEVRSPGGAPRENPAPRPRRSRLPSAPHSGCESSCPEKGPATRTDGGSVRFGVGGSPAASASRKRQACASGGRAGK